MVALDLDDTILERAAGAAAALEFSREILKFARIDRHARDRRDDLSTTTLGGAAHAHDSVAGLRGVGLVARLDSRTCSLTSAIAAGFASAAGRADAAVFARIDEAIAGFTARHGYWLSPSSRRWSTMMQRSWITSMPA